MAFFIPLMAGLGGALGATGAAAAGVGIASVGTAVSVLGTAASALSASNAASFQASLARQQGQMARDQASVKAGEVARGTKQSLAAIRAGAVESGFEFSGSMLDLHRQAERSGELDYLTAVYDGSVQATGLNASARMYKRQASSALIGGALGAASQALGGVASVYKGKALTV